MGIEIPEALGGAGAQLLPRRAGRRGALARGPVGRRARGRPEHAGHQRAAALGQPTSSRRRYLPQAGRRRDRRLRPVGGRLRQRRLRAGDARRRVRATSSVLTGRKLWITNAARGRPLHRVRDGRPGGRLQGHHGVRRRARRSRLQRRQEGRQARHPRQQHLRAAARRRAPCRGRTCWARSGKGYKVAIETLNEGRIGIGAQMVGLAQGRARPRGARTRRSASSSARPIAEFQGVQFQLARAATELEAARLLGLQRRAAARRRRAVPHGGGHVPSCSRRRWPSGWRRSPSSCSAATGS